MVAEERQGPRSISEIFAPVCLVDVVDAWIVYQDGFDESTSRRIVVKENERTPVY